MQTKNIFSYIIDAADDPCFPNPCQNGGLCSESGTDYTCNCPTGFKGKSCESKLYCMTHLSLLLSNIC